MKWSDDQMQQLRDLWAEGHSTAEIGRRMGVSKNAVIGKARRLEVDARKNPIIRMTAEEWAERDRLKAENRAQSPKNRKTLRRATLPPLASASDGEAAVPVAKAVPSKPVQIVGRTSAVETKPPVPAVAAAPAPLPAPPPRLRPQTVTFRARKPTAECCWPIGEPGTKKFRMCDALALPGKPYCDEHYKIAYIRPKTDREATA